MMSDRYPPGVCLHVPHDSTTIPQGVRGQFALDGEELRAEIMRMTDHRTLVLFRGRDQIVPVVAAHVSRLVVDVERFELDEREPMAAIGMGCVYRLTSDGKPLRRDLSIVERESLISSYYQPHHQRFAEIVDACLRDHKIALIIDCHSFPSRPLPYELEQNLERPDVCIGTDVFHTPEPVRDAFVGSFTDAGFSVAVNRPFSGAIVPSAHYLQNRRVLSVMVEINRGLYWDEAKGKPGDHYVNVAERIRAACRRASSLVINEVNRAKI